MEYRKYVGRTVDMIYVDRSGKFTKRRIKINGITDTCIRAYCYSHGAPRTFNIDNVLAMQPVIHHAAV